MRPTYMTLTSLFPALLIGGLLLACAEKKPMVGDKDDEPSKDLSNDALQLGGTEASDSLFFAMERTPCFGRCKAYRINVYRSGYATYEGRMNVEKEGMHEGWVGKDTLDLLLKEAGSVGFFALNDRYDSDVTDLPSSILRVVADGKDKRVVGRIGTPPAFTNYFEKAESLLYPMPWKPVPAQE